MIRFTSSHHSGGAGAGVLAVVLTLLISLPLSLPAAVAKEGAGGGDGGRGSGMERRSIVFTKKHDSKHVYNTLLRASRWDGVRFTLHMPNATPLLNRAVLKLAFQHAYGSGLAALYADDILGKTVAGWSSAVGLVDEQSRSSLLREIAKFAHDIRLLEEFKAVVASEMKDSTATYDFR